MTDRQNDGWMDGWILQMCIKNSVLNYVSQRTQLLLYKTLNSNFTDFCKGI